MPDEVLPVVVTTPPTSVSDPDAVTDPVVEVLPFTGVGAHWAWLAGGLTSLGIVLIVGARRDETA